MITLKESLLNKTKSKVKSAKSGLKEVTDEIKNLPTMSDFKLWDKRQWRLEWRCPNLIQVALESCGKCNNPLLNEPIGFTFHFNVDNDTIYPMTLNKKGMFFPIMGWGKFEAAGNDNHRKKVILDIIKKLSDVDNMTKLFDHYNNFCFSRTEEGKSLLNDL